MRSYIFRHYVGFAFFCFVWVSEKDSDQERIINHEKIHFYQQLELLFLLHWVLYGVFYCTGRLRGYEHDDAYRKIPFEREAYAHEKDPKYLTWRRPYAWLKYCW